MSAYGPHGGALGPKRPPRPTRRLELSPAEQVAVVGALQRDLALPDVDTTALRAVLARLLG